MAWTRDQLEKMGEAEEVQLASLRADGTLRPPTTIWLVRVGNDLYVRSVHGREGKWWQRALERHAGNISGGGVEADVIFEEADSKVYDDVSAAYRAKYSRYPERITATVLNPESCESTLRLINKHNNY